MQLETERLRLVPVADEHVEQIFLEFREPVIKNWREVIGQLSIMFPDRIKL